MLFCILLIGAPIIKGAVTDTPLKANNNSKATTTNAPKVSKMEAKYLDVFGETGIDEAIVNVYTQMKDNFHKLKEASNSENLVYNVLNKYWQDTRGKKIDFVKDIHNIVQRRYQNDSTNNATERMLDDTEISFERYTEIYPKARNFLVNNFDYPDGSAIDNAYNIETGLPEEMPEYLSPDQILHVAMTTCQGDNRPLKADQYELVSTILGREEFERRATIDVIEYGVKYKCEFKIGVDGVYDIKYLDTDKKPNRYLVMALNRIIKEEEMRLASIEKEKEEQENKKIEMMANISNNLRNSEYKTISESTNAGINSLSLQEKDLIKGNFDKSLQNAGLNLNRKQLNKVIAEILSLKDLTQVNNYSTKLGQQRNLNLAEINLAFTALVLAYKRDLPLGEGPKENSLFSALLRSRKHIFESDLIPNQYGLKTRIEELKKANTKEEIMDITRKIMKRNPTCDPLEVYRALDDYKNIHSKWYEARYDGKKAENPFIKQSVDTRTDICDVIAA